MKKKNARVNESNVNIIEASENDLMHNLIYFFALTLTSMLMLMAKGRGKKRVWCNRGIKTHNRLFVRNSIIMGRNIEVCDNKKRRREVSLYSINTSSFMRCEGRREKKVREKFHYLLKAAKWIVISSFR